MRNCAAPALVVHTDANGDVIARSGSDTAVVVQYNLSSEVSCVLCAHSDDNHIRLRLSGPCSHAASRLRASIKAAGLDDKIIVETV